MNSFVSVYYYLKVIKTAYFEPTETDFKPLVINSSIIVVLIVTVLGTLGFGLFPQELLNITKSALVGFL